MASVLSLSGLSPFGGRQTKRRALAPGPGAPQPVPPSDSEATEATEATEAKREAKREAESLAKARLGLLAYLELAEQKVAACRSTLLHPLPPDPGLRRVTFMELLLRFQQLRNLHHGHLERGQF